MPFPDAQQPAAKNHVPKKPAAKNDIAKKPAAKKPINKCKKPTNKSMDGSMVGINGRFYL